MFRFEDIITFQRIQSAFPDDTTKTEAFLMGRGIAMPTGETFLYPKTPRSVVITGECDYSITEDMYQHYRNKARTWFSTHTQTPNVRGIPLGICNKTPLDIVWACMNKPRQDQNLVYMNFSIQSYPQERQSVWDLFKDKTWVTPEESVSLPTYFERLRTHRFVLCPRGYGVDTHRMWETLYLGAIPIVRRNIAHDDWKDLPIVWIDDWNQVTPEFLATVDMSERSVEKARLSYWVNLITKKKSRIPWVL